MFCQNTTILNRLIVWKWYYEWMDRQTNEHPILMSTIFLNSRGNK